MDVTCTPERDLSDSQAREIIDLQHAAFVETPEFAHQRWYHTRPADEDLWFTVGDGSGKLVGSVRLVHRRIGTNGGERVVGGIANVCSHPDVRGRGAARAALRAAQDYIAGGGQIDYGMLFCGPTVRGFYAKLGWHEIDNGLVYIDPAGRRQTSEPDSTGCTMLLAGRQTVEQWPEGEIDLNGPDW